MRRIVALAAAAALLLAGCAAIPTSGPIGTGDVVISEPGQPIPLANDPPQDGSPEDIVLGFLGAAAAGLSDEFVVARKYLSPTTAWDPTARVLVYPVRGGPEISLRDDGTAVVRVPVEGSLDRDGVWTEAPADAHEELAMELVQDVSGQWRITALDDVVLMSASDFDNFYRRVPVYFVSADMTHLVPDLRWFPASRILTYAVRALLAGPSAWLRDAVVTGTPEGARLGAGGVTLTDQTAVVDLSPAADAADQDQRSLLLAQLSATLAAVPGTAVSAVVVSAQGGAVWEPDEGLDLVTDVQPQRGPYVIAEGDDTLEVLTDGELTPVEGSAPLPATSTAVAVGLDGETRVVLDGTSSLLLLPPDGSAPVTLLEGSVLVAPSVDRFDWVWTAGRQVGAGLTAVSPDGTVVTVAADWLEGSSVRSVAVARDGSRVAVVHAGANDQQPVIDVAAVLRDESGVPQGLGERVQVGASLAGAGQVAWMDEITLAVLAHSGTVDAPTMHLVPVGGQSSALPLVDGAVALAAGRGDRELYLAHADGTLLRRQGASWVVAATGVRAPAFPG
jgi:hypothetical protein